VRISDVKPGLVYESDHDDVVWLVLSVTRVDGTTIKTVELMLLGDGAGHVDDDVTMSVDSTGLVTGYRLVAEGK